MLLNFRVLAQAILSAPRRVLFALVLYTSTVVNSVRFLWWAEKCISALLLRECHEYFSSCVGTFSTRWGMTNDENMSNDSHWRHLKSLNGPFTHMHATLDKVVEWLEWVTF